MKDFNRKDPSFSLCGLNCILCPMHIGNYCPGCGGGPGNQTCSIARCSQDHDGAEYCFQCQAYPCTRYEGIEILDSFISHRNQKRDQERAKQIGLYAYHTELHEKSRILHDLLENHDDGRHKSFFCLTVNLLELGDLKEMVAKIEHETDSSLLTKKEKAKTAENLFREFARDHDITLKLNKKK